MITQEKEHLFNSSVCEAAGRFAMAYESDDSSISGIHRQVRPVRRSGTLAAVVRRALWHRPLRGLSMPPLRNGYYYLLYLEQRSPRWFFETYVARSKDLIHWELSSSNPVLSPGQRTASTPPTRISSNSEARLTFITASAISAPGPNSNERYISWIDGRLLRRLFQTPGIPSK